MPLFSVIIPTYNRAELLRRALLSVADQTCDDFEVLVCDDGSTDNTREVVEYFQNRMVTRYLAESMNWGGAGSP